MRHPEKFGKLERESEEIRELNSLNEYRRNFVDDRKKYTQQLRATLKEYYPQAIDLVSRLDSPVFLDLLMKWSTFEKIQKEDKQKIRKFFYKHNLRSETNLQKKFELIDSSISLSTDQAIVKPHVMKIKAIVAILRNLNKAIEKFDEKIKMIFENHEDSHIFNSFSGAGETMAPRLLAAFGTKRENFESALEVSTVVAVAPVEESSGKQTWIHWRWAASTFLRQTFVEFAGLSVQFCPWAKVYYDGMKEKGKSRNAILRALAFKWIRIIFACWQKREKYDEETYIKALIKSGSWVGKRLKEGC